MAVYPERRRNGLSGKWIAEVTRHGERRRKRFKTKLEAQRWADFTKVTGAEPDPGTDKSGGDLKTFGAVVKEAKVNHEGWAANRDPSRWQRLECVVDVFGADTPVSNIDRAAFERLVTKLKSRKAPKHGGGRLSPATINRYLAVASAVLRYARAHDYIRGLPEIPWQQEAGTRIHWLTAEAEQAVHAALLADGRVAEALTMRVLTATGMRWSEFATLTPGQVAGDWIKLDHTKTNTPRDVPIDVELGAELLAMVKAKRVPNYHTFRKYLKRALKSAGQSAGLGVHSLRHTTATRLVHGNVNLSVVKDYLGHANLNTTLKYTHVSPQLLQDAMKILSPHAGQTAKIAPQEDNDDAIETIAAQGLLKHEQTFRPTSSDTASFIRDSPDDCRFGVDIRIFPAFLQDRGKNGSPTPTQSRRSVCALP